MQNKVTYTCDQWLVPIGCDCHPAHVLKTLGIRKHSLPFDWLNVKPLDGIRYVEDNLKNEFRYFLSDLKRNENHEVIAAAYPYAVFMHDRDIISNEADKEIINRKIELFKNLYSSTDCYFLYNIPGDSLNSKKRVDDFTDSIIRFSQIIKPLDQLKIYIRHEEDFMENRLLNDLLCDQVAGMNKVSVVKYVREKHEYGLWGNPAQYPELLQRLDIKLR